MSNTKLSSIKTLIIIPVYFITAFFSFTAEAQTGETAIVSDSIHTAVDIKPEFPGGMNEFYSFISKNFKSPKGFTEKVKVLIQFVVERDGSLVNIKVLRDPGRGAGAAAVKLLKKSPQWIPGTQNGKRVRVLYTLPIIITPDTTPTQVLNERMRTTKPVNN